MSDRSEESQGDIYVWLADATAKRDRMRVEVANAEAALLAAKAELQVCINEVSRCLILLQEKDRC